jgi:hypothetical protein
VELVERIDGLPLPIVRCVRHREPALQSRPEEDEQERDQRRDD